MNFEVNKEIFTTAIQKAERVTDKSLTLPILKTILIEALQDEIVIKATNGELGVEIVLPANITTQGKVAVPGNIISSYISSLPAQEKKIQLEDKNGSLAIKSAQTQTIIKCVSTEDFPSIPKHEQAGSSFEISSKLFIEGCKSVLFCAATSSIKPELSSVYIYADGDMVFVATDSFRLAEKKIKLNKPISDWSVLIPAKNVTEIIRILDEMSEDVEIKIDNHQISFSAPGMYVTSRVIQGNFPDYRQIIPKETKTKVTVLKQEVSNTFKSISVFSDKFFKLSIHVNPEDKKFSLRTSNVDIGESEVSLDATIEGEKLDINFNFKYIADCLPNISGSSIVWNFNSTNKLLIQSNTDTSYMYLVMPMNR